MRSTMRLNLVLIDYFLFPMYDSTVRVLAFWWPKVNLKVEAPLYTNKNNAYL
jgi:hypothetical protein